MQIWFGNATLSWENAQKCPQSLRRTCSRQDQDKEVEEHSICLASSPPTSGLEEFPQHLVLCRAAVEQHQLLAARQQGHQSRILHEKKSWDRRLGHDTFFKTVPYIFAFTGAKKWWGFYCFKKCSWYGSDRIRIAFGRLVPDPDPGWQKMTHKKKRTMWRNILLWGAVCSLFSSGGLGINILQCFLIWFFYCKILVIKSLDPDPDLYWPNMLDPAPHWNKCGFTTLDSSAFLSEYYKIINQGIERTDTMVG